MVSVAMEREGGKSNTVCLNVDGDDLPIMASTSGTVETRYVQQGNAAGTLDPFSSRPIVFPLTDGPHTISLESGSGLGNSHFTNRRLWATVFHPAR